MSRKKESLGTSLETLLTLAREDNLGELPVSEEGGSQGALPEPLYRKGLGYLKQGDYLLAAAHFLAAVHLDPGNLKAWNNLAVAYFYLDRPQESRLALEKALELDPDNSMARENLALVCQALSRQGPDKKTQGGQKWEERN